jgi:hypothetical protein
MDIVVNHVKDAVLAVRDDRQEDARAALRAIDFRARMVKMSRALPNPTLFWPGIEDWSPRSLMAPNTGNIQTARLFHQKLKL